MPDVRSYESLDLFYLGREIDPATGRTTILPLLYKNKNLTTHAAILGMTGSGKTGLGVCLLEEAAIDRLPAIVIDPKGDMANLLLTFPDLLPQDFLPWVDQAKAEQKGISREELAGETAKDWTEGLRAWDQDPERIARLRDHAEFGLYTPGSTAGRPVSVLDSLGPPPADVAGDGDTLAGLVNSAVSSILGLIGIKADPLNSREHILLSSIIIHHWRQQRGLTLESLIREVVSPPFDRIGVFPLDTFYPQAARMELAMGLNNIVASPSFSGWLQGESLEIDSLLYSPAGKPRISVFSISHLSDAERMFFVTLILGRLISWMRRQEGSSGLRCLLYMDEIFGFFPPVGNPPSKEPMLLLLKQARAYGLGVILATQNPVDLDYKGMANIGTWFIGRLQTRQDQDRVISGLSGASRIPDQKKFRKLLSAMRGRTFLMHSIHTGEPLLFETRWVLSYLKGPISLAESGRLQDKTEPPVRTVEAAGGDSLKISGESCFLPAPPVLTDGIEQRFVPPPIPAQGLIYQPWIAGSAVVRFVSQSRGIDQQQEVRLKVMPEKAAEWRHAVLNPFTPEMTTGAAPAGMRYMDNGAVPAGKTGLRDLEKSFADYLYRTMSIPLQRVADLKLESKPGESESLFRQRMAEELRRRKGEEIGTLEEKYRKREQALARKLAQASARVDRERDEVRTRGMDTAIAFGVAVFGAFFGRRKVSVTTATRSAQGMRSAGRLMKDREDVRRAGEEVARIEEEIALLAAEMQEQMTEAGKRFVPDYYTVEEFSVTPRRSDIFNIEISVQWEPVMEFSLPGQEAGGA